MELFLFKDILIIFAISIVVLLIGYRLHIPPVVGFLITGLLAGPHGLGLVGESGDVEMLAQIGIVLLLFGIGMEFSIKKLVQIKRLFLLGGSLQVGLTVLFSFLIAKAVGRPFGEAVFLGFLLSMSSTAIVLRLLEQKGESSSPHGRLSISVLIFQDMVAIPMILFTPILGGGGKQEFDISLFWQLITGLIILLTVFISAQRLVPRLLFLVARTRNKELFLLSVFTLCFGVAWLTSSMGLSLTIGAFLAGLIISESEYSNEAISNIFPFQALFISFFFVSIGMLLDLRFVIQQPFTIIMLAIGIICLKAFAAALTTLILGMPIRTAVMAGIALSQIGEFSFVLAKTGIPYGLGTEYEYQLFLAASLLTLAVSPVLINASPRLANLICRLPLPERLLTGLQNNQGESKDSLQNHILIIGFGISGKNLARSSKLAGIPYAILEMNPDTVREQKRNGEPIHFGDASHLSVLEHLNVQEAKAIAVLVNDPIAARQIVKIAREANPSIYIIVRTRYVQEMALMNKLGADEAIPDEFGSSVEIFSRVLRQYHVPDEEINKLISDIRADGYELLRNQNPVSTKLSEIKLNLSNVEIASFRLHASSPLVGKPLSESQLRQNFGMTVLLIRRDNSVLSNPGPSIKFCANDIVVVVGEKVSLKQAGGLFGQLEQAAPIT
ncbi:cation:proton antiporter [Candidatus Protochlamydia phocaeensis]|uniref:cation:proton antiporter domain-containing protein n=1 Tax=Candidatus Protochlamydia phocaeensis TaxID=1414722 RepID=UPI00083969A0|nr:cation:proton antiporter [Candidatus Protochlamydia phocaeensis]